MTVNRIDCDCTRQGPSYYSHKLKHSIVRYEIGLNIFLVDMCWANCSYEAGRWNNINISRNSLISRLGMGERVEVEVDDGYIGEYPQYIKRPKEFVNPEETRFMQQRIQNRQETASKRLKQFEILKQRYIYDISKHSDVLRACAVLTQVSLDGGDKLFSCAYRGIDNLIGREKRRSNVSDDIISISVYILRFKCLKIK